MDQVEVQKKQITRCAVCARRTQLYCQKCKTEFYCCRQHQIQDWKNHKSKCEIKQVTFVKELERVQKQTKFSEQENQKHDNDNDDILLIQPNKFEESLKRKSENEIIKKLKIIDNAIKIREGDRKSTLFHFLQDQYTKAILFGNKTYNLSQKITSQFQDNMIQIFQTKFQRKTSHFFQQMEELLDLLIMCKIYSKYGKKQQVKNIIESYNFDAIIIQKIPSLQRNPTTPQLVKFNRIHEQISRYEAILKSFILILSSMRLSQFTQSFYDRYLNLVESTNDQLAIATVHFQRGAYYHQNSNLKKAELQYYKCREIRQKFGQTLPLSDVLLNIALLEKQLYGQQMDSSSGIIKKITEVLRIKRNNRPSSHLDFALPLECLGKIYMQKGEFNKSLDYLQQCFILRRTFLPAKHTDKKRIEAIVIFLYNTLVDKFKTLGNLEEEVEVKKLTKRIQNNLFAYKDFNNYEINAELTTIQKLTINTNEQLFRMFNSKELMEYKKLLQKIERVSKQQGIKLFQSNAFIQNLPREKRILFFTLNPFLRTIVI